ncbi:MAG: class I SAM-dependent methyltransferase [Clostridia bacterium]|nr:class I SAM-dependent methyltransferase [Clostridia bacterium]
MHIYDYLNTYYTTHNEHARLGSRHGSVEFLTTVRYVERYLTPDARICEIGTGTGRYAHYFAQKGYPVDAVELIEHNIEVFNSLTQPGEPVTVRQGDARDLGFLADNSYDITLLLGPMYHLYTEADQRRALTEAIRVTRPGGVIFTAYCMNDATVVCFLFQREGIHDPHFRALVDFDTFKCSSNPEDLFALYRREEIDALMDGLPVTRLHFVGTDMATNYMRPTVDAMDDATFDEYLRYHFAICERADMVGTSHHTLDIFRKDG